MVRENLIKVQQKIDEACERSGRDPKEVTLIAVSKTKPIEMIEEAIDAGKTQFGENKAQEMKEKYEALPKNLEWHFIGHLQTNKVKYVVGRAGLIHSVDSLHLAEAIEKECEKKEINVYFRKELNRHRLVVIVENTYTNKDVDIDKIYEKNYTSKNDKENHGLGLYKVRKILSRNNNLNLFTTKNSEYFKQQLEIYY